LSKLISFSLSSFLSACVYVYVCETLQHFAPVDYKGSEQDMDGWEVEEEEIESDTDEGTLFENLGLAAEQ
jgi:hypothetical protein